METESYRADLSAAYSRIEQLEDELALFRSDPSFERVEAASSRLEGAREVRRRLQRVLPLAIIASFTLMGAFALTDPSLPPIVRMLGQVLAAAGAVSAITNIVALLAMTAQGSRPKKLVELERQLRIAKGDVGDARRLRIEHESENLHEEETRSFDERLQAARRR